MKNFFCFAALVTGIFVAGAAVQAQQKFVADLSGLQEIPANNSGGRGKCVLELNQAETQLNLNCRFENLSSPATTRNLGIGASVGETAPMVIGFVTFGGAPSGNLSVTLTVTPQIAGNLRNNRLYFKVGSQNFPQGEIRGQFHLANGTYNDFDGDGRSELTVYRSSNRSFYAQSSLNGSLFERQIGQAGDSVSLTVDFDGDGKSDFSTARYNAEVLWRIFDSSTNVLREVRWGSSTLGDFFAAADYDGDGTFDIAVFRAGVWHIIESSTGNYRTEYFGQSGDVPAPNDFDRDGKTDLTVARSENGARVWYVRRSSDLQFYKIQWGLSSDAFFTGRTDWDGDGAADIAVIRNESGQRVFYIRRSSDSQLQTIRWGASSDVVKLGDYDGDGKTDAAVTRAVSGGRVFLILQSSNDQPRYEYFGLAGDF